MTMLASADKRTFYHHDPEFLYGNNFWVNWMKFGLKKLLFYQMLA